MIHRLAHCRALHQAAWLCRLEATRLSKVVEKLQNAERAAALKRTRETLSDLKKGVGIFPDDADFAGDATGSIAELVPMSDRGAIPNQVVIADKGTGTTAEPDLRKGVGVVPDSAVAASDGANTTAEPDLGPGKESYQLRGRQHD